MGFCRVILKIPHVGDFSFDESKGWNTHRVDAFVRGFKRGVITHGEMPTDDWCKDERRGYVFGDRIVLFLRRHSLPIETIYRTGVICEPTGLGEPDNRGQCSKNLF